MNKIDQILGHLGNLQLPGELRVFGSVAKGKVEPFDVDVVLDLRASGLSATDAQEEPGVKKLLGLAGSYYAWLDPFLRTNKDLLVRNDRASGWTVAKQKRALLSAMDTQSLSLADAVALRRAVLASQSQETRTSASISPP